MHLHHGSKQNYKKQYRYYNAPRKQTLRSSFTAAGKTTGSPEISTPWASAEGDGGVFANNNRQNPAVHNSFFAGGLEDPLARANASADSATMVDQSSDISSTITGTAGSKSAGNGTPATATNWKVAPGRGVGDGGGVDAAIRALKLAVVGVTRRLMDDVNRLPLRNRTTAVLVDGSRMSLLALELAGAAWKFGR